VNSLQLVPVSCVTFERVEPSSYSATQRNNVSRYWAASARAHPSLFDGPIICARGAKIDNGVCRIYWTETSYSYYLYSQAAVSVSPMPTVAALFTSVLLSPAANTAILGRMAGHTSTPSRVQLPGGNVELPHDATPLTITTVSGDAVRELHEETGVELSRNDLTLWAVTIGEVHPNVGVIFRAIAPSWDHVKQTFDAHSAVLIASGQQPELQSLIIVQKNLSETGSWSLPIHLHPQVEHLPSLLHVVFEDGAFTALEHFPRHSNGTIAHL
jgi:8-oxo-dGTP pyrophosphatase MutT (NUDIX family)